MAKDEELYTNLVNLLRMFKNRPYHLAKYLIDNSSLSQDFINKLLESDKLKKLSEDVQSGRVVPVYFVNIQQMEDFYTSFIDDIKVISKIKSPEEAAKEINEKLDILIMSEKFEEAARVRDYMINNGIKRISK